jgi:hypothetical protein
LDADKNTHSKGDSYDAKKGSSFMVTEMAEGDVLEEVKEDHKLRLQMSKFLPVLRLRQAGK